MCLQQTGELTPILVSLVSKDSKAHSMLDPSGVKLSQTIQDDVKDKIRVIMQRNQVGPCDPSVTIQETAL